MNPNTNTNYLTNSLAKAQQFAGKVASELRSSIYQSKYGYGSNEGSVLTSAQNIGKEPAKVAATAVGDVLTNKSLSSVWKYTNVPRMAGELGKTVAQKAGLDPLTGAVLTAAVPVGLMALSGVRGPISQGLRPPGYKAVAPKSKEEDPTGRTPQSVPLELALRYGLGQRSQILPYQEFKKERPDVSPSTYVQYRRYEQAKPQPGSLVGIDPEGQSFTTVGGLLRGSAKGLNDPELRIKGFPVTLSGLAGTAAGLGTAVAAYRALPQEVREARTMQSTSFDPEVKAERAKIETQLAPLESKQAQVKQVIQRLQRKMQAGGIRALDQYGPSPDDQAALRVHREAISNRAELNKITDNLNTYTYALGRATGKIPEPPQPQTEEGQALRQSLTAETKARVAAKLNPDDISYTPSDENISYLQGRVQHFTDEKQGLLENVKGRLEALNIPEKALNLQDRLTRAKFKSGALNTQAQELQAELRSTYRPVTVTTPSTATVAGLAAAGAAAALGTAYVTKKLLQKSAERRIKKESPVEYLKHKHGSLEQASTALGQPQAQSWQQLVPHIK
jgi:chaperonin cofactor prefoldin